MISFAIVAALTFHAGASVPNDVRTAVDQALHRPVNPYGVTLDEIGAYLRRRIPAYTIPADGDEWRVQADALRKNILDQVVFRGVPETWRNSDLDVQWGDTIETQHGYRIRKLRYAALPGLVIPALLYEPVEIQGQVPAVLNVNGHYSVEGKAKDEEQIRCIDLAKQGFISLHPEWIGCGELNVEGMSHNRLAYLDLCGVSGVSAFYLAMERGLDVLESLPTVDAKRIAMTGLSGGGWQTILLSALDTRISLSAPNAGYIGMEQRVENLREVGDLEQAPTDLVWKADYTHLTAMLAPRPALLLYNAKDDCCFTAYRARASVYDPSVPVYELYGHPDRFAFHMNSDPGNHNYGRDNREQFFTFLRTHFRWGRDAGNAQGASDGEVMPIETLRCGIPEDNATLYTLADKVVDDLPRPSVPKDAVHLRELLRYQPLEVSDARTIDSTRRGGVRADSMTLATGEWKLPVVVLAREDAEPTATTVIFGDSGKAKLVGAACDRIQEGERVVAVDPLLMGESNERPDQAHYFGMLLATMGERALGIQTAQVAATVKWAATAFPASAVQLDTQGWNASVVALAAVAMGEAPIAALSAHKAPESLKALVRDRVRYEEHPALFCFGLLEAFDVPELKTLAGQTSITWDVGGL